MTPAQLQVGRAYYRITYADNDLTVPGLEPMIYVGTNIYPDDDPKQLTYYFQDTVSYSISGNVTTPPARSASTTDGKAGVGILTYSFSAQDLLKGLVDLPGAISALQAALSRRQLIEGKGDAF
jgi:hypothetical protein